MTNITGFLADLVTRFFSKKPHFFAVIQIIAAIFAGANVVLTQLVSSGVISSSNSVVSALSSGIAMAISVTTLIVAQLPKKDANATAADQPPAK